MESVVGRSALSVAALDAKRVAVVLPSLVPTAGAERVMLSLASEFTDRGCTVDLLLVRDPLHATVRVPDGVRILEFGAPRLRSFFLPFVRYLRQTRPDAVLVSLWPLTSICGVAHRFSRSSARLVVCEHNTLSLQYQSWGLPVRAALAASLVATLRLADERVAVSDGVAGDLAALSRLPRRRFEVIHNPMPLLVETCPDYARVEAAWRGWTGRRILAVGRLKAQKNHALLVRAFRQLRETQEARLMILGWAGESEAALKSLIDREGLQDDVILAGAVDDPGPFYERADLFVSSSDYEGLGNVIIEALAFGCPIVSTDCPSGPAEILENGKWGRLTPVGDVDALTKAMRDALAEPPPDREALKLRAAEFAPSKVANSYLRLLLPGRPNSRQWPKAMPEFQATTAPVSFARHA